MSEPQTVNPQAFQPFDGGLGKRLTVTTASASVALPGLVEGNDRIIVTNGGDVSAFVRFGGSTTVATLDCMEVLPGTTQVFSTPYTLPGALYVAAITESSAGTKISVVVGRGA